MCSQESFDTARTAHGTDHDILFVFSESSLDLNRMAELTAGDTCDDLKS